MRFNYALLALVISTVAFAGDTTYELGGHSKLRLLAQSYPDDSLFRDLAGASSVDTAGELRLNFSYATVALIHEGIGRLAKML